MIWHRLIAASLAWWVFLAAARPFADDYAIPGGADAGLPGAPFDWVSAVLYFGGVLASAWVPERYSWAQILAWTWPVWFWLGFIALVR